MSNLLEIKPYIQDFVERNLDESFEDKVYWLGERKNVPSYPYCTLSVIAENKDKRTSLEDGDIVVINNNYFLLNEPCLNVEKLFYFPSEDVEIFKREKIVTRYKTCTMTVAVYNAYVEDTAEEEDTRRDADEFAYSEIDKIEGLFEDYPINSKFSIQNISSIRPLHETVDGGFMYRYEFDLTIGYNEILNIKKSYGKSVEVSGSENFKVTIKNNDNIELET